MARAMTNLEATILNALLAGEAPQLEPLRAQVHVASVLRRELSGVGFFTHFAVPPDVPRPGVVGRMVLSDIGADIEGVVHGSGFALFIQDGILDFLEGFTYSDPWPAEARLLRWYYLHPKVTGGSELVESTDRDLGYALRRLAV